MSPGVHREAKPLLTPPLLASEVGLLELAQTMCACLYEYTERLNDSFPPPFLTSEEGLLELAHTTCACL